MASVESPTDPFDSIAQTEIVPVTDFDTLTSALRTLPCCQRCKKGRRRCDTLLPACNRCRKAGVECLFYDHSVEQILPRSYIQSLLKSLQRLKEQKAAKVASQISCNPSIDRPGHGSIEPSALTSETPTSVEGTRGSEPAVVSSNYNTLHLVCYGSHFPVATPQGPDLRYLGASSVFSLAVATVARLRSDATYTLAPLQISPLTNVEPNEFHGSCNCTVTKGMVKKSMDLFMESLYPIYPFLDADTVFSDLEAYWDIEKSGSDPDTLCGDDAHRYFRIKIIASIASASRSRHDASRIACDHGCYLEAIKCVAKVTSEVSADSLRALMLLIIYCLFRPRKGDIWKLLDYACRLSLELGYNKEPDSALPVPQQEQQRYTFWSLYAIERIVGQLFGRPSDLPESMITTEYPGSACATKPGSDTTPSHLVQACHHYRLVYLRSAIFSDMYMTDREQGGRDLTWYQGRLSKILDWYQQSSKDMAATTVSSLTCSVAFHSTVLFVFQPLVLEVLHQTRASSGSHARTATSEQLSLRIPAEVYTSACRLIEVYEKILQGPRGSVLGCYPITFMSAHYIFMASMMLMAYCALRLDGRVAFPSVMGNISAPYAEDTAHIRGSNVLQISNSCLILLTFCAEKWPGMGGMRDTCKQLSDQTLTRMLRLDLE